MGVGRKPKPRALRLVTTPPTKLKAEARRAGTIPEPTHDIGDPPAWMSLAQQEIWRFVVDHAVPGQIKLLDCGTLAAYCVAADKHREATEKINAMGLVVKSPVKGDPMQNPFLAIVNRQAVVMMRAAAELGLTPTARVRLAVRDNGDAKDDDYDI